MKRRLALARDDERLARIGRTLDAVRASTDVATRIDSDPVGIVRRYTESEDQEVVGLIASSIAFGNVKTIRAKLEEALQRLGPSPARVADDEKRVHAAMRGWTHRVFRGEDIARLAVGRAFCSSRPGRSAPRSRGSSQRRESCVRRSPAGRR